MRMTSGTRGRSRETDVSAPSSKDRRRVRCGEWYFHDPRESDRERAENRQPNPTNGCKTRSIATDDCKILGSERLHAPPGMTKKSNFSHFWTLSGFQLEQLFHQ